MQGGGAYEDRDAPMCPGTAPPFADPRQGVRSAQHALGGISSRALPSRRRGAPTPRSRVQPETEQMLRWAWPPKAPARQQSTNTRQGEAVTYDALLKRAHSHTLAVQRILLHKASGSIAERLPHLLTGQ
jgi:hypothetical protein